MKGLLLIAFHDQIIALQTSRTKTPTLTIAMVIKVLNEKHPVTKGQFVKEMAKLMSESPNGVNREKAQIHPPNVKLVIQRILAASTIYSGSFDWQIARREKIAYDISKYFKSSIRDNLLRNVKNYALKQWKAITSTLKPDNEVEKDKYKLVCLRNYHRKATDTTGRSSTTNNILMPLPYMTSTGQMTSSSTTSSSTGNLMIPLPWMTSTGQMTSSSTTSSSTNNVLMPLQWSTTNGHHMASSFATTSLSSRTNSSDSWTTAAAKEAGTTTAAKKGTTAASSFIARNESSSTTSSTTTASTSSLTIIMSEENPTITMGKGRPDKNSRYAKFKTALWTIFGVERRLFSKNANRMIKEALCSAVKNIIRDEGLCDQIINGHYAGSLPNNIEECVRVNNVFEQFNRRINNGQGLATQEQTNRRMYEQREDMGSLVLSIGFWDRKKENLSDSGFEDEG
jgi:hypothetical protein